MIWIIDFEDSFTHNIWSVCQKLNLPAQVIEFIDLKKWAKVIENSQQKQVILYGPGPGHPLDYLNYSLGGGVTLSQLMESFFKNPQLFQAGICLGHQLIWSYFGYQCVPCKRAVHGQRMKITIPSLQPWRKLFLTSKNLCDKSVLVQRYHSLMIDSTLRYDKSVILVNKKDKNKIYFLKDHLHDEIVIGLTKRVLTYQFHPESIGTENQFLFFEPFKSFLYGEYPLS
jgi:anthranilate/para-aminobenzoate synthase component II